MLSLLAISTYQYLQLFMLVQHQTSSDAAAGDCCVNRTELTGIWDETFTDADQQWPSDGSDGLHISQHLAIKTVTYDDR